MVTPAQPEIFGRYTLLHRLAVGGMAEIYLARDERSEHGPGLVVIKRLRQELQSDPEHIKMLVDEEAILSRLDHRGIVKPLDFGKTDGRYYVALEHVWGESLAALLTLCAQQRTPFPLKAALHIGAQVAHALAHAHASRLPSGEPAPVVHRDVTLGNVMVSYQGEVKVLDFGIARTSGRLAETQLGMVKGTLEYQAPEQVAGEPASPATDQYQLGVLLYKLLVGCAPVDADDDAQLLVRIRAGEVVRPGQRVPGFPPSVELLLMTALAREPTQRFASARHLAEALEAALGTGWHRGDEALRAMLESLGGERHRRQRALVDAVLEGRSLDPGAATLLERDTRVDEPARFNVELSTFLDAVPGPRAEGSAADLPFASAELLAVAGAEPQAAPTTGAAASLPPPSDAPLVDGGGPTIGAYRVLGRLGQGAFGESFHCRDTELSREVVVKMLRPELVRDELTRQRFLAGARSMAKADAAELVRVFHVGEHEDRPFLTMEWLEGQDLGSHLASGPLDVRTAVEWLQRAAAALDKLEQRGLHHGNLKPSNLFVGDSGLHFGDLGMGARSPGDGDDEKTTGAFRAPELAAGLEPDARADIYALGAILFCCVMGSPPATGTAAELQLEGLPPQLAGVLRHMLATDPAERFSSPAALARALGVLASTLGPRPEAASVQVPAVVPAAAASGFSWRRPQVIAAALAVLGIVVASVFLLSGDNWASRLAAGEAAQVQREIAAIPQADRTPDEELYLGHALNDLKTYDEAFEAYARAIAGGAFDDRVQAFMLEELDARKADDVVEVFRSWPGDSVDSPLKRMAEEGRRWERLHALEALRARGKDALVDMQKLALRHLVEGSSCEERRRGVRALIDVGRDATALAAVKQARSKILDNMCMQLELDQAERAIQKRIQAR
ncbi:MAG: serine/threonine-protein kinase [Pseudomonadota bacterium]